MRSHWLAGQYKLRGKRFKALSCGCCEIQDFRPDYNDYLSKKEIQNFVPDSSKQLEVEELEYSLRHDE